MNRREMLLATLAAGLAGKAISPGVGTPVSGELFHEPPLACTVRGPGGKWVFFAEEWSHARTAD